MDHRSGSASQGTSPLKAAGFLVGLLVVVALAFALGMKAGRELDVLRPDRGGETVKLRDGKAETLSDESTAASRRDDGAPKRGETTARATPASEPAATHHDGPVQTARTEDHAASAPQPGRVGDEPAPASTASTAGVVAKPPAPAPLPGPDYTIFRSAPGAAGAPKPTPASAALDTTPSADAATRPSASKPEPSKPPKEPAPAKDTRTAAATAVPSAAAGSKPATSATGSGQLKITPDASSSAEKSASASPGFVVQVAALQSKGDADQLATRLKAHGAAPYITKVELPNGTWYRVRVGKFKTTNEAKAAQRKLAAEGFRGAEVMSAR